jgi:hypothetical protein
MKQVWRQTRSQRLFEEAESADPGRTGSAANFTLGQNRLERGSSVAGGDSGWGVSLSIAKAGPRKPGRAGRANAAARKGLAMRGTQFGPEGRLDSTGERSARLAGLFKAELANHSLQVAG